MTKTGIGIGLVIILMVVLSAFIVNDVTQRYTQMKSEIDHEHESLAKGRRSCEAMPLYETSIKGDLTLGTRQIMWMNDYNSFVTETRGRSVGYGEVLVSLFPRMYGYAYYALQENAAVVYVCRA